MAKKQATTGNCQKNALAHPVCNPDMVGDKSCVPHAGLAIATCRMFCAALHAASDRRLASCPCRQGAICDVTTDCIAQEAHVGRAVCDYTHQA